MPLTAASLSTSLSQFFETFREQSREDVSNILQRHIIPTAQGGNDAGRSGVLQMWSWGGKLDRPVPEDWKFPRGSVKAIMDLIVFGHPHLNIRALRKVSSNALKRSEQQYFIKAMKIYKILVDGAVSLGLIPNVEVIDALTCREWDSLFSVVYNKLVVLLNLESKAGVVSVNTLYNKLKPHGTNVRIVA